MKLKENVAINSQNENNVILYDIENDEMISLNEEASIIFKNIEKNDEQIVMEINKKYEISNIKEILNDIADVKMRLSKYFYE